MKMYCNKNKINKKTIIINLLKKKIIIIVQWLKNTYDLNDN